MKKEMADQQLVCLGIPLKGGRGILVILLGHKPLNNRDYLFILLQIPLPYNKAISNRRCLYAL